MGDSRSRVNYDQISHLYDGQPYRSKEPDANLLTFLSEPHRVPEMISVLDIGCGTGNQLVADLPLVTGARLVGLDRYHGMLKRARPKAESIQWVQGDGAKLPFADGTFDYITSQFSFHHVQGKRAMLQAVHRLLRANGRFILTNICPREMPGWAFYQFFPISYEIDLGDFMPRLEIAALLRQAGFTYVNQGLERINQEIELGDFLDFVRQRNLCSQLITMTDLDYQAGLKRLEQLRGRTAGKTTLILSEVCLLTMTAEKT